MWISRQTVRREMREWDGRGDIALFCAYGSLQFLISAVFLEKWLLDVKAEQNKGGGIPVTVPLVRVPLQWEIMIPMAVDHWGDVCILAPWAEYLVRGDRGLLERMYPVMKKYLKACKFWAELFSAGKHRRIWKLLHHYGDWCAPGVGDVGVDGKRKMDRHRMYGKFQPDSGKDRGYSGAGRGCKVLPETQSGDRGGIPGNFDESRLHGKERVSDSICAASVLSDALRRG